MSSNPDIIIRYQFIFSDDRSIEYEINLDPETCEIIPSEKREIPFWCRMDYAKCDHCDKHTEGIEYCPLAVNSIDLIDFFQDTVSYDVLDVIVETNERKYFKEKITIQRTLGSLFGIIMVTSGCKDLDKLRPMARFHLPFATIEETVYRVTSMYQLAQYLRTQHGLEPDLNMQELIDTYKKIHEINVNFVQRLQKATEMDANLNAVAILDTFSQMIPLGIRDTLKDFEGLFSPYLK
jgi:hypothetical protein